MSVLKFFRRAALALGKNWGERAVIVVLFAVVAAVLLSVAPSTYNSAAWENDPALAVGLLLIAVGAVLVAARWFWKKNLVYFRRRA